MRTETEITIDLCESQIVNALKDPNILEKLKSDVKMQESFKKELRRCFEEVARAKAIDIKNLIQTT